VSVSEPLRRIADRLCPSPRSANHERDGLSWAFLAFPRPERIPRAIDVAVTLLARRIPNGGARQEKARSAGVLLMVTPCLSQPPRDSRSPAHARSHKTGRGYMRGYTKRLRTALPGVVPAARTGFASPGLPWHLLSVTECIERGQTRGSSSLDAASRRQLRTGWPLLGFPGISEGHGNASSYRCSRRPSRRRMPARKRTGKGTARKVMPGQSRSDCRRLA
jgi:hypothetical protein